jgi:hypothetical protein
LSPSIYGNNVYTAYQYDSLISENYGVTGTTQPLVFTNNNIWGTNANGVILDIDVTTVLGISGTIINNNNYYAPATPSSGTSFNANSGALKTFSAWQGLSPGVLDPNSTAAKPPFPNWCSPSTGNFSICP